MTSFPGFRSHLQFYDYISVSMAPLPVLRGHFRFYEVTSGLTTKLMAVSDKYLFSFYQDYGQECIRLAGNFRKRSRSAIEIIKSAGTVYRQGILHLDQYRPPRISNLPIDFDQSVNSLLTPLIAKLEAFVDDWGQFLSPYFRQNGHTQQNFMPNCKNLFDKQPHPSKLIEPIERKLRDIFEQSIVYVPIAIVSVDRFDAHALDMYVEKYIADFEAQFDVQLRKKDTRHLVQRLFTRKNNWKAMKGFAVFDRTVLLELGLNVNASSASKKPRAAATNGNKAQKQQSGFVQPQEIYSKLKMLVEKLNNYGQQAFSDARANEVIQT